MKTQWWLQTGGLVAIAAVVTLAPVAGQRNPDAGGAPQMRNPPPNVKKRVIIPPKWTPASRTPDGQPDLQGVWTNFDTTPMERAASGPGSRTAGPTFNSDFDQTALEGPISP